MICVILTSVTGCKSFTHVLLNASQTYAGRMKGAENVSRNWQPENKQLNVIRSQLPHTYTHKIRNTASMNACKYAHWQKEHWEYGVYQDTDNTWFDMHMILKVSIFVKNKKHILIHIYTKQNMHFAIQFIQLFLLSINMLIICLINCFV